MNTEATQYFYPNGFWGGYNRFFSPSIPSRIGEGFVQSVRKALQGDDRHRLSALFILQSVHSKKVNKPGMKPPFPEVLCYPTEEAKVAVKLLSQLNFPSEQTTENEKP
jgi:hypothetical protein